MKKQLNEFFGTLFSSWGSDTPPEAIWAANDLLPYLEKDFPGISSEEFIEDDQDGHNDKIVQKYFS